MTDQLLKQYRIDLGRKRVKEYEKLLLKMCAPRHITYNAFLYGMASRVSSRIWRDVVWAVKKTVEDMKQ